jgi:uncharacterized protein YjbI with pentapeptide repeats
LPILWLIPQDKLFQIADHGKKVFTPVSWLKQAVGLENQETIMCAFNRNELESILKQRGLSDDWINTVLSGLPDDWSCRRKPYRNGEKCIFHAETKDPNEFKAAFNQEFKDMEKKGKFDFIGFIFPEIDFSNKIFSKPTDFVGATFQAETDFMRAIFKERVFFIGNEFQLQSAHFTEAQFEGIVAFVKTIFFVTSFTDAKFHDFVLFDGVEFLGGVFFDGAEFQKGVSFKNTTFRRLANFQETTFKVSASFFSGTTFQDEANFQSIFQGEALFDGVTFLNVSFTGAVFYGKITFVNCVFVGSAVFNGVLLTTDGSVLEFIGDPQKPMPDLQQFWSRVETTIKKYELEEVWEEELNDIKDKLNKIMERGRISLRNVSLRDTDMQKVRFLNVEWNREGLSLGPLRMERLVIYDEKLLKDVEEPSNYEAVARIYWGLRRNYERNGRYAEAGDFYISEMEMRRLQIAPPQPRKEKGGKSTLWEIISRTILSWGWWRRNLLSPLAIYKYLSLYGESYTLASLWIFITVLLFTFLRAHLPSPGGQSTDLLNNLARSVFALFQLRGEETIDNIERIIGAILTGNLFIALRRRLERR